MHLTCNQEKSVRFWYGAQKGSLTYWFYSVPSSNRQDTWFWSMESRFEPLGNNNKERWQSWFIAPVLKTGDLHGSAGSNPALSSTITGCGLIGKSPLLGSGHHPGSSPGIPTNVFVAQLVQSTSLLMRESQVRVLSGTQKIQ